MLKAIVERIWIRDQSIYHKFLKFTSLNKDELDEIYGEISVVFNDKWIEAQLKIKPNNRHRLFHSILNPTPPTFTFLTNLGVDLIELKYLKGYSRLIERLRDIREFSGVLFEIEIAAELKRSNFDTELEPIIITGKKPDLRFKVDDIWIYVEIFNLQLSKEDRICNNNNRKIDDIIAKILGYRGYKYEVLHKKNDPNINLGIIKEYLLKNKQYPIIFENKDLKIIITKNEKSRGVLANFNYLLDSNHQSNRIERIITKKLKQLPKNQPSLIFCKMNPAKINYPSIRRMLNKFWKYPNILGLIIISEVNNIHTHEIETSSRFYQNPSLSSKSQEIINLLSNKLKVFFNQDFKFILEENKYK